MSRRVSSRPSSRPPADSSGYIDAIIDRYLASDEAKAVPQRPQRREQKSDRVSGEHGDLSERHARLLAQTKNHIAAAAASPTRQNQSADPITVRRPSSPPLIDVSRERERERERERARAADKEREMNETLNKYRRQLDGTMDAIKQLNQQMTAQNAVIQRLATHHIRAPISDNDDDKKQNAPRRSQSHKTERMKPTTHSSIDIGSRPSSSGGMSDSRPSNGSRSADELVSAKKRLEAAENQNRVLKRKLEQSRQREDRLTTAQTETLKQIRHANQEIKERDAALSKLRHDLAEFQDESRERDLRLTAECKRIFVERNEYERAVNERNVLIERSRDRLFASNEERSKLQHSLLSHRAAQQRAKDREMKMRTIIARLLDKLEAAYVHIKHNRNGARQNDNDNEESSDEMDVQVEQHHRDDDERDFATETDTDIDGDLNSFRNDLAATQSATDLPTSRTATSDGANTATEVADDDNDDAPLDSELSADAIDRAERTDDQHGDDELIEAFDDASRSDILDDNADDQYDLHEQRRADSEYGIDVHDDQDDADSQDEQVI